MLTLLMISKKRGLEIYIPKKLCLLYTSVMEAPDAIKWLNELGVMFDKDADGRMAVSYTHLN